MRIIIHLNVKRGEVVYLKLNSSKTAHTRPNI